MAEKLSETLTIRLSYSVLTKLGLLSEGRSRASTIRDLIERAHRRSAKQPRRRGDA